MIKRFQWIKKKISKLNNKRARKYIKNKSKLEIIKIIFEISDGQLSKIT